MFTVPPYYDHKTTSDGEENVLAVEWNATRHEIRVHLEVVRLVQGCRGVSVDDGTETIPLATELALDLWHRHDAFVESQQMAARSRPRKVNAGVGVVEANAYTLPGTLHST